MINLETISGLPLELDEKTFKLKFNPPLAEIIPDIRKFSDMIPVLIDRSAEPKSKVEEMYYMYRDIHLPADEAVIRKNNIRYDITVIPPVMIGKEFNKTVGHYHPIIPGSQKMSYPEIYEVLEGQALFLIQKMDQDFKQLISFYGIVASVGDKVIYPPNYGHIIVNIGKGVLVTGNWTSYGFKSLYEPIKDRHGMAYYVLTDDIKPFVMVKNEHYADHPPVRMLTVADKIRTEFGFESTKPMYTSGINNPKLLEFLNNPTKYAIELSTITS